MTNRIAAFLVMQDAAGHVSDHHLAVPEFESRGWQVREVPWRSRPDWNAFDAVFICAPWDYVQHSSEFQNVLRDIDGSSATLFNPLSLVEWNLDKRYLRDLAARGATIVPSLFPENLDTPTTWFEHFGSDRLVIKPTIGAGSLDTYTLDEPVDDESLARLRDIFRGRGFIVQPFIDSVRAEGELSLFFMNGDYSHAISKLPRPGDFRVQEEFGGDIQSVAPPAELLDIAESVFANIEPRPVYGRGDWVRGADSQWLLMELELIEPSLYLRTDSGAAARFARAFNQRFEELASK